MQEVFWRTPLLPFSLSISNFPALNEQGLNIETRVLPDCITKCNCQKSFIFSHNMNFWKKYSLASKCSKWADISTPLSLYTRIKSLLNLGLITRVRIGVCVLASSLWPLASYFLFLFCIYNSSIQLKVGEHPGNWTQRCCVAGESLATVPTRIDIRFKSKSLYIQ